MDIAMMPPPAPRAPGRDRKQSNPKRRKVNPDDATPPPPPPPPPPPASPLVPVGTRSRMMWQWDRTHKSWEPWCLVYNYDMVHEAFDQERRKRHLRDMMKDD